MSFQVRKRRPHRQIILLDRVPISFVLQSPRDSFRRIWLKVRSSFDVLALGGEDLRRGEDNSAPEVAPRPLRRNA